MTDLSPGQSERDIPQNIPIGKCTNSRHRLQPVKINKPNLLLPEELCVGAPDVVRVNLRWILRAAGLELHPRDSAYRSGHCPRRGPHGHAQVAMPLERGEIVRDEFVTRCG